MPTTVITGRDLILTIDSKTYDAQATSVTLSNKPTLNTYQTIDGKAYKHTDDDWSLSVTMLADWGATGSLLEAMWTSANSAPNTALAFSLTAATGAVVAGNVFPVFPDINGAGADAQSVTLAFQVSGTPTITIT
jgi:hypothetical protein